jgi:hypothetical protein
MIKDRNVIPVSMAVGLQPVIPADVAAAAAEVVRDRLSTDDADVVLAALGLEG